MGACVSKKNIYEYTKRPNRWKKIFESLRLTEQDLQLLYRVFLDVDIRGTGTIDINELMAYMGVEHTRFLTRAFSLFDYDGSNEIDFSEFVIALWNYCSLSYNTLGVFSFLFMKLYA
jgi:Ca2+-binding EF-hand superfamily protein